MTKANAAAKQMSAKQKEKNSALVKGFIPIAKFIAQISGPNCEVVLHDLNDMESSIVCIENGHVTGRGEGGSITGFALRTVFDPRYHDRSFVTNYLGRPEGSDAILRSSTFFIRNDEGDVVGLLCTNVDVTAKKSFMQLLQQEVSMTSGNIGAGSEEALPEEEETDEEQFNLSLGSMVESAFQRVIQEENHLDAMHMLAEEKRSVVAQLDARRIFMLRGAVGKVARLLCISEPTLYRYIREVRESQKG